MKTPPLTPLLGTLNQDLRGHFSDSSEGPSQSTPSKSSSTNTAWPKGTRVKVKPYRAGTLIIERHPRLAECDLDIINVMGGVPVCCVDLDETPAPVRPQKPCVICHGVGRVRMLPSQIPARDRRKALPIKDCDHCGGTGKVFVGPATA
ncbi:MAG: hypothetical protein V4662_11950 [Verrucomicrobiota bacterium]